MTMTVKEAAFYRGGREARYMRQPRDANPYGRYANPAFHAFWDAGWEDADRSRDESSVASGNGLRRTGE